MWFLKRARRKTPKCEPQPWNFSKFQWFLKVLQRWKFSNFGLIGSRSGSRIRKRTDAHFSCVLLTGNKSRKSEVGVLQVKRLKITNIQVRNRIDRYDFMKISSKIKRRSASIHIILKKFIPLAVPLLLRDPLRDASRKDFQKILNDGPRMNWDFGEVFEEN